MSTYQNSFLSQKKEPPGWTFQNADKNMSTRHSLKLYTISPTPFSCYRRAGGKTQPCEMKFLHSSWERNHQIHAVILSWESNWLSLKLA